MTALRARRFDADWVSTEAQRIIGRFRWDFLNEEGLISRNNPPDGRTILDNFDDLAPFMAWWGAHDLLVDQVSKLTHDDFDRRLPLGNLLHAYKIDEYLGGLHVVAKATGDAHARALLDDAVERSWGRFADPDNGLAEFYDYDRGMRSPFFSPWAAGLLETFLEIDEGDGKMARRVEDVLDLWWCHPFVDETGMLPFRGSFAANQQMSERFWARAGCWAGEAPIRWNADGRSSASGALKRSRFINLGRRIAWQWGGSGLWSQLMKSNTTPVFLAIALFARNRDPMWRHRIMRWLDVVAARLAGPNGVLGAMHNGNASGEPDLVASFITIDVACDAWWYVDRDDTLLELADRIARACLRWRWESGLIPMTPSADRNHLDGQIDFAIALRRVAELTKDPRLRDQSVALLHSALAAHDTPGGYCTHVRRDGSIVGLAKNTIDPKYNGLVLKGLLSLATLDRPIYGSSELSDLFKDR